MPPQYADLHPLVAKVLYARHIETVAEISSFLSLAADEADPFALPDMGIAVQRIVQAIADGERIVVYGDFDVDGITATALLVSALGCLGARVSPYIPDRFEEGYGLNCATLEQIRADGADLLVTVDCGIRSPMEVSHAQGLGLDVILTDHHSAPPELPPALAVISPKRPDSAYPFRDLAGVGVAYRLVQALSTVAPTSLGALLQPDDWLDLVALGTVADVAPLVGENRGLVGRGLQSLRNLRRPGVVALIEAARVSADALSSQDIAFRLAPRLNATGRLEHAMLAYALLTCDDVGEARRMAAGLERLNTERQELLAQQVTLAEASVGPDDLLIFVQGAEYHEGIVGLVASRLVDRHHRPTLVMRTGEETTRGSARSPALVVKPQAALGEGAGRNEFSITRALEECSDLLTRYGGHAQAAGYTLPTDRLPAFRERLVRYCERVLDPDSLRRTHRVDAIISLDELDESVPAALHALGPFGEGNPAPAFASEGLEIVGLRPLGNEGQHVRLTARQNGRTLEAIAFRQGHIATDYAIGDRIDLLYQPEINTWRGQDRLQLVVIASRKHGR
jgi:single-stranded-DNA-specific exonuclease